MTTTLPNAFTVDDLEAMPGDRRRYGLIAGAIVAAPAPGLIACEPYADSVAPVTLAWPVAASFPVADLARPRAR